jgi:tetratricopeptide (TPR) repeat protein
MLCFEGTSELEACATAFLSRACADLTSYVTMLVKETTMLFSHCGSLPVSRGTGILLLWLVLELAGASPASPQETDQLKGGLRALYQGKYETAAVLAEKYLKTHPGKPEARVLLARARIAQSKPLLAYSELRKALQDNPGNIDALYYLGQLSKVLSS